MFSGGRGSHVVYLSRQGDACRARERAVAENVDNAVELVASATDVSVDTIPAEAVEAIRWFERWRASSVVDAYTGPLPGILAEIDSLIGRKLTLKLLREFGGRRITFPAGQKNAGARIIRVVGEEAARILMKEFGGAVRWDIPVGPLSVGWMRTVAVRALLVHGQHSVSEIARRCSLTERMVYKHRALLVEIGVLERRFQPRQAEPAALGLVSLLLEEKTPLHHIARQLNVPLAEVERQAEVLQRRGTARGGRK